MIIYPLIVLVVSAAFTLAVLRQYLQRHRPYQLIWTIALTMAVAASLSYIIFLEDGKSELAFRVYYLLGALLMAAYLGMGSLMLAARSAAAQDLMRIVLLIVTLVSVAGAVALLTNPIDTAALHKLNGEPGTNVFKVGPYLPFVIVLNSFGALAVIGVALYSGWQLRQRNAAPRLVGANVLIALGTIIISTGSSLARLGNGGGFWLAMATGWVVIFGGFLLTFAIYRPPIAEPARGASAVARP